MLLEHLLSEFELHKGETYPALALVYHIASIFDMQINIKERVDVNQDGHSLIIEAPPPPGPQIAKDVFHI